MGVGLSPGGKWEWEYGWGRGVVREGRDAGCAWGREMINDLPKKERESHVE